AGASRVVLEAALPDVPVDPLGVEAVLPEDSPLLPAEAPPVVLPDGDWDALPDPPVVEPVVPVVPDAPPDVLPGIVTDDPPEAPEDAPEDAPPLVCATAAKLKDRA